MTWETYFFVAEIWTAGECERRTGVVDHWGPIREQSWNDVMARVADICRVTPDQWFAIVELHKL